MFVKIGTFDSVQIMKLQYKKEYSFMNIQQTFVINQYKITH